MDKSSTFGSVWKRRMLMREIKWMKGRFIFLSVIALSMAAHAQIENRNNRVSVDLDGHLRYERLLPYGFNIGTDWRYVCVIEGTRLLHADQQPQIWFVTVSHSLKTKLIDWENRISLLDGVTNYSMLNFRSILRKTVLFEERWGLSPFIRVIDYGFDADAYGKDWWEFENAHHAEIASQLGLDLQLYF